jgi:hypothetical protein
MHNFLAPLQRLLTSGSVLELGLLVVALAAVGIALRVRSVRRAARRTGDSPLPPPAPSEVTTMPTARQWLAREAALSDLPPLRETVVEPTPEAGALAVPQPPAAHDGDSVDDTIVFPTGRSYGEFKTGDLPPPRNAVDLPEASTIASILTEGLDDLATGGDRLADSVRERPIQYLLGALAAGFAAGLMFPMVYGQQRVTKLLERLIESNEELKHVRLLEERREARAEADRREIERFRQSRPS